MAYVTIAVFFGLAGGMVGRLKGSSFFLWFLISAIVPVFGLVTALVYRYDTDEPERACPRCGKVVKLHDAICTRCGTELEYPGTKAELAASH
jgi:DNA-directed RNA polymerase subunit RPC12/RpoP